MSKVVAAGVWEREMDGCLSLSRTDDFELRARMQGRRGTWIENGQGLHTNSALPVEVCTWKKDIHTLWRSTICCVVCVRVCASE